METPQATRPSNNNNNSSVTLTIADSTPLTQLFQSQNIRVAGTAHNPLFVASDVAKKIGDRNLSRNLKRLKSSHFVTQPHISAQGKSTEMNFLTEQGLYKYLMKSDRLEAEPFQDWVFEQLREIRLQLINSKDLEIKIANDKLNIATMRIEEIEFNYYRALPSTYDPRPLDSCSDDMADFYITRYFSIHTNEKTSTIKQLSRNNIPQQTMNDIYELAYLYYKINKHDQAEFETDLWKILDKIFIKSSK